MIQPGDTMLGRYVSALVAPFILAAVVIGDAGAHAAATSGNASSLSHGRFKQLAVYAPVGTPASFVLLLSGDEGWSGTVIEVAQQLRQHGALVVGIDLREFKASLQADGAECVFPDGDLENLSHFVQAYYQLPSYLAPMLIGYSAGATLAYAALAQAPRDTFASVVSLSFCPALNLQKPLCKGSGVNFIQAAPGRGVEFLPIGGTGNPWLVMQGENDRLCPAGAARAFVSKVHGAAFVLLPQVDESFAPAAQWLPQFEAAFDSLAAHGASARNPPAPPALGDLPIIEVPARAGAPASDSFAILMSGDGGWAGLDQDIAAALAADGIAVVGLDSLRYYWTARTPEGLAADTDRMIRYYLEHMHKRRVLLIGYSQGADVLPFAVNRLPQATRARVALVAVLGLSEHALFEFHLSSWVSDSNSGRPTLPEVSRMTGMPVLCIYGEEEKDSLCPKLDPSRFSVVKLKGGHHFDGDYAGLAREILSSAAR
jgi:type IV secretory pathway VirJ component